MEQNKIVNIYLELTKTCNLSCSYCYVPTYNKNQKKQTTEQAERAIDEIIEKFDPKNGVDIGKIIFHGSETFVLEPETINLAITKLYPFQKHKIIGVQTNGVALTSEYHDRMGDHSDKFLIGFSIDAKPVHDKYRNNSFDTVWENVLETKRRGYRVKVLSVITKEVVNNHLPALTELLNNLTDLNIDCSLKFAHGSELYTLNHLEQVKFGEWCIETGHWKIVQGMSPAYCSYGKCNSNAISELSLDGDVFVCNKLNKQTDSTSNWKTDNLLEAFKKRDVALTTIQNGINCQTCPFWQICLGGCPADRDSNGYAVDCVFKRYVWSELAQTGNNIFELFFTNIPKVIKTGSLK